MGFFLVNKPKGITSFDVVRKLRKKLNIRKIGHTGTLDPLASGLMLVATGVSTKMIEYSVGHDKQYRAHVYLDGVSETCDAEGPIRNLLIEASDIPSLPEIQSVLSEYFSGAIEQIPPKYSAIKIDGKRAYAKVRNNEDFEMPIREVVIYDVGIVDYTFPELVLDLHVSSGTYIRSIARDLGSHLTGGAYLSDLKRTWIDGLHIDHPKCIHDLDGDEGTWDMISYEEVFPDIPVLDGLDQRLLMDLILGKKGLKCQDVSPGNYLVMYPDDSRGLVQVSSDLSIFVIKNNV